MTSSLEGGGEQILRVQHPEQHQCPAAVWFAGSGRSRLDAGAGPAYPAPYLLEATGWHPYEAAGLQPLKHANVARMGAKNLPSSPHSLTEWVEHQTQRLKTHAQGRSELQE